MVHVLQYSIHCDIGDGVDSSFPWKQPRITYLPREISAGPINLNICVCVCVFRSAAQTFTAAAARGAMSSLNQQLQWSQSPPDAVWLTEGVLESGREKQRWKRSARSHGRETKGEWAQSIKTFQQVGSLNALIHSQHCSPFTQKMPSKQSKHVLILRNMPGQSIRKNHTCWLPVKHPSLSSAAHISLLWSNGRTVYNTQTAFPPPQVSWDLDGLMIH